MTEILKNFELVNNSNKINESLKKLEKSDESLSFNIEKVWEYLNNTTKDPENSIILTNLLDNINNLLNIELARLWYDFNPTYQNNKKLLNI